MFHHPLQAPWCQLHTSLFLPAPPLTTSQHKNYLGSGAQPRLVYFHSPPKLGLVFLMLGKGVPFLMLGKGVPSARGSPTILIPADLNLNSEYPYLHPRFVGTFFFKVHRVSYLNLLYTNNRITHATAQYWSARSVTGGKCHSPSSLFAWHNLFFLLLPGFSLFLRCPCVPLSKPPNLVWLMVREV